jgi:hypothetical protein
MRIAALVVMAALICGCGSDGEGESAAVPTPEGMSVEAVADGLESGSDSVLNADPSAGPDEVRCVAQQLTERLSDEELSALGLPQDLSGMSSLFSNRSALRGFFAAVFECLDMRSFVIDQLALPDDRQAACVADLVVDDEDVRLLFVLGTRSGSPGPPEGAFAEELSRLDEYTARCASAG